MTLTLHFPHWLAHVAYFVAGGIVGGWITYRVLVAAEVAAIGRAFGW